MQFAAQLAICCRMQCIDCYHMLVQLLFVALCRAVYHTVGYLLPYASTVCYLLLYAVQFAICRRMQYIVATCHTVSICCCMPRSLLFVAARCTICYLLPLAIQLSYSLIFIAACHTACYLLLHGAQLAILFSAYCTVSICCSKPCSLPHFFTACYLLHQAVQLAIYYCVLCSWLFIAAQASIIWGEIGRSKLLNNRQY